MAVGVVLVIVAQTTRLLRERGGVLFGEGLFALRVPKGLEVESVAPGERVEAGAVLARFSSPEREAKIDSLKLKKDVLEAERRITANEPLPLDAELVRRHQDLVFERRHLEATTGQLIPARNLVERERVTEIGATKEKLTRLDGEAKKLNDELNQARLRKKLADDQLGWAKGLSERGGGTQRELAERQTEAEVLATEVKKLEAQLASAAAEKGQLERDLARLEKVTAEQSAALGAEVESLSKRLAALPGDEGPVRAKLAEELKRAESLRQAKLEQIALGLRQCEAELGGLERELTVPAPFSGRIAYRDPAPRTAWDQSPILVLAPEQAFRLKLRVPAEEAGSLTSAVKVLVELKGEYLERRFHARPLSAKELVDDPGYAVAELACEAPGEAVRDLVYGKAVVGKLAWSPPFYVSRGFWAGAALAAGGAAAWWVGRGRKKVVEASAPVPVSAARPVAPPLLPARPVVAATAAGSIEHGSLAPLLRQQACQLREAICRGEVDGELLSAVEWSLDRHQARGVRLLRAGLGEGADHEMSVGLERLVRGAADREVVERLLRVVKTIGGEALERQARRLQTRLAPDGAGRQHVQHVMKPQNGEHARSAAVVGADEGRE